MNEFDNGLEKKFKFDFSDPEVSKVNVEKLKEFLLKDSNPVLIFYGGEPLLQWKKIIEIIDSLEDTKVKFRMQTNGILLDVLPIDYLKKIDKILISLDGDKIRTDQNRGNGTYEKVMQNIFQIKKQGYTGELIARMTIAQDCPDLYEQVLNLIKVGFTSIHWQLDVGFYKEDYEFKKIKKFLDEINISTSKLIDWWMQKIKKGKVYKFYPFIGIIKPLIFNLSTRGLRCGAGHSGYAITTSGKIVHCPIMNSIESFKAGDLNFNPRDLKKFDCKNECGNCEFYDLCGGRCMYWRKAKLWPQEGDEMICNSIKFYINSLKEKIPEIKDLIDKGVIQKQDFDYEDYFGPEIIP
jgi:putative peptide-modifying radical SAM enzyme